MGLVPKQQIIDICDQLFDVCLAKGKIHLLSALHQAAQQIRFVILTERAQAAERNC